MVLMLAGDLLILGLQLRIAAQDGVGLVFLTRSCSALSWSSRELSSLAVRFGIEVRPFSFHVRFGYSVCGGGENIHRRLQPFSEIPAFVSVCSGRLLCSPSLSVDFLVHSQAKADLQRLVHTGHGRVVQAAHMLFEAAFINGADLLEQNNGIPGQSATEELS